MLWKFKVIRGKGKRMNLDPTEIKVSDLPLPIKVEEFLSWVRERHGESVSAQCRSKLTTNALWGKTSNPVRVLNDIIYPADQTFQGAKIGKIKFVV